MNKFLEEFKNRGFFYQCTDENELSNLLSNKNIEESILFQKNESNNYLTGNKYFKLVYFV